MSGQFPLDKDTNFDLPSITEHTRNDTKTSKRSVYAGLNTEKRRLKHLWYRDDLMCRQIVLKN